MTLIGFPMPMAAPLAAGFGDAASLGAPALDVAVGAPSFAALLTQRADPGAADAFVAVSADRQAARVAAPTAIPFASAGLFGVDAALAHSDAIEGVAVASGAAGGSARAGAAPLRGGAAIRSGGEGRAGLLATSDALPVQPRSSAPTASIGGPSVASLSQTAPTRQHAPAQPAGIVAAPVALAATLGGGRTIAATNAASSRAPAMRPAAPDLRANLAGQPAPVTVTLHAGAQGVQVAARISGASEADIERLALQTAARDGIDLSALIVNGRRVRRPAKG